MQNYHENFHFGMLSCSWKPLKRQQKAEGVMSHDLNKVGVKMRACEGVGVGM